MRLVSYLDGGQVSTGALVGEAVVDLPRLCGAPADMPRLLESPVQLERVREALEGIQGSITKGESPPPYYPPAQLLLPPVPRPGKIIGVGMNYPAPGQSGRPPYPVLFERNAGSLVGHGEAIRLPPEVQQAAIECELALVVGKGGKRIPKAQAVQALAGYTLANDVTARDLEQRSSQWTGGKLLDAFLPVGPAIVTLDELTDPLGLRMRSWINDELVQEGSAGDMLYDPAELVAYISTWITLQAGDIILTGSPKGMPGRETFLKPGDRVRVEIERLGSLENPVEGSEGYG